ncbi:MAG: electron transfer flavoprotein subunit alpha/FixB family protein [Oscillospiraceae bacterium]|nr:electron transfer flavoprotein subunit alpha/FixB family protein [Oscillospiraceae bacterium]
MVANFNSADIAAFKNVWVFCEQRQGVMMPTTFELISEGRKLADELGVKLCGLLLGDNIEGIAKELGGYGADEVIVCDHPLLKNYTTDAYANVICDVVSELKPEVLLIAATNIGRDLGPRCAARLHTGLCADCTHLDVDMPNYKDFLRGASTLPEDRIEKLGAIMLKNNETGAMEKHDVSRGLKMTRPAFGGNLMASIVCPRFRPAMATVRPGVMKKNAFDAAKAEAVAIVKPEFTLTDADVKTEVVETVKAAKKLVDLIGADFIVSVGRGISKDVEGGIKLAEELAEVLGGVVGGSRVAIDNGWLTADHQVGQTGKTVHPKVYIALGISGSIQHKAGMSESECIIAVNKNETAPIFEVADYGICGDLFKVTPMLIEAFKAAKAAK